MDKLPYWLYDIIMYPEEHRDLGMYLTLLGFVMIFVGTVKLWW